MASKGKLKVKTKGTFKQHALMFTSRGELSTWALEDVIVARKATAVTFDSSVSDGQRRTKKGRSSLSSTSGASASKASSIALTSTTAINSSDIDYYEVHNLLGSTVPTAPMEVGNEGEASKKPERSKPKCR
jgi:hypothetical protein